MKIRKALEAMGLDVARGYTLFELRPGKRVWGERMARVKGRVEG